jgi:hypothetical protein
MTDYEKVMTHVRSRCAEIKADWNGDVDDEQAQRADDADELLELLDEVDELVKELNI